MEQSSANTRSLRRILPAQVRSSQPGGFGRPLEPRRTPVPAACNACRKHKVKCSGERPVCHRCAHAHVPCKYVTRPGETPVQALRRYRHSTTVYEELFELLKKMSAKDAQDVLNRIRAGDDPLTLLNHAKAGDLLLQMAVRPETRFRYEFPYQPHMPSHYAINNPYLDSLLYEAASLYPDKNWSSFWHTKVRSNGMMGLEEQQSMYLKPFHAAEIIEPRLSDIKISWWTNVSDDDVFMQDLLRGLLRCEYQFTAAFQKDMFFEDMAAHRTEFCSSLLVNIVLAYSCVCCPRVLNRAEHWNPRSLTYRFIAEAKRIWELEALKPRITTIQAGILFSVVHNLCGLDELGKAYRVHAVALAHKLRLFNGPIGVVSNRVKNGLAFTAWALYNWETHSPLLTEPPIWPLPDPSAEAHWYGEIWVKYPLDRNVTPLSFSHIFLARCHFRIIMNEFCSAAFSNEQSLTLDQARHFHYRLERWYDGLKGPLEPKTIALPGHLQIHIYYHHLLLTMYEPLLENSSNQEPCPQQIVDDTKRYLETLVRLYYLRHGFEAMDLFIVIPLMLMVYDAIDAIDEQTAELKLEVLRSTLILAAQGIYSQHRNHYLARALFTVIRGRMRKQEVALLKGTVGIDDVANMEQDLEHAVRSEWPVSVVKRGETADPYVLTNLVENYVSPNKDP